MAAINNVRLDIFDNNPSPGRALVQISYKILGTHHDIAHEQKYRELVQLIGVDEGPGEDGRSEPLPIDPIWDGPFTFGGLATAFDRTREGVIPTSALIEDAFFRRSEIRARVTLEPLPATVSGESNIVLRHPANSPA